MERAVNTARRGSSGDFKDCHSIPKADSALETRPCRPATPAYWLPVGGPRGSRLAMRIGLCSCIGCLHELHFPLRRGGQRGGASVWSLLRRPTTCAASPLPLAPASSALCWKASTRAVDPGAEFVPGLAALWLCGRRPITAERPPCTSSCPGPSGPRGRRRRRGRAS